jgi:hypothetical protein
MGHQLKQFSNTCEAFRNRQQSVLFSVSMVVLPLSLQLLKTKWPRFFKAKFFCHQLQFNRNVNGFKDSDTSAMQCGSEDFM